MNYSVAQFAAMFLISSLLCGCREQKFIDHFPERLVLEAYSASGEMLSEQTLEPSDVRYQRLKKFIESQKEGWSANFVSYKASPYVFRGERIIVRCYAERIIVDVTTLDGHSSYKRGSPGLLSILGLP